MTTNPGGPSRNPALLAAAAFGLLVPNGLFVYWLLAEFPGWRAMLGNHLALAFILDTVLALVLVTCYVAARPIGPVRWPWFVVLSLLGGLGFSLPFYYWLNLPVAPPDARRRIEGQHLRHP